MYRHVELSRRAEKDLKGLTPSIRKRIVAAVLAGLTADPAPENLDVKPLKGHDPWLRLRVGAHRVIFRPLNSREVQTLQADDSELRAAISEAMELGEPGGWLVDRIIDRRDLDRAVASL